MFSNENKWREKYKKLKSESDKFLDFYNEDSFEGFKEKLTDIEHFDLICKRNILMNEIEQLNLVIRELQEAKNNILEINA